MSNEDFVQHLLKSVLSGMLHCFIHCTYVRTLVCYTQAGKLLYVCLATHEMNCRQLVAFYEKKIMYIINNRLGNLLEQIRSVIKLRANCRFYIKFVVLIITRNYVSIWQTDGRTDGRTDGHVHPKLFNLHWDLFHSKMENKTCLKIHEVKKRKTRFFS